MVSSFPPGRPRKMGSFFNRLVPALCQGRDFVVENRKKDRFVFRIKVKPTGRCLNTRGLNMLALPCLLKVLHWFSCFPLGSSGKLLRYEPADQTARSQASGEARQAEEEEEELPEFDFEKD